MGYQIVYGSSGKMIVIPRWKRIIRFISGLLLIAGILAIWLWSSGADWAVAVSALDFMAENISGGVSLQESLTAFCHQILRGAKIE